MFKFFKQFTPGPPTGDLLPIVIPTEIVEHPYWPGPSVKWGDILSVTWGHFKEPHITTYLTRKEATELARRRKAFAQIALGNLRVRSAKRVWSHIKKEEDEIHFLGLLHEDGLGPSRLLLREELRAVFPEGFSFCVPERTCAVVFSKNASQAAMVSVHDVVDGCFREGREAVSNQIFDEEEINTV